MDASGITAIFLGDSGDPSRHTSFDSKSMLRAPRVEATLRFICFTCRSTPLRKSGSRYFNDLDQASDFGVRRALGIRAYSAIRGNTKSVVLEAAEMHASAVGTELKAHFNASAVSLTIARK